jgi:hypothetical protein
MKMEHQLTSLELAKKLKELGVKQESSFQWWRARNNNNFFIGDGEGVTRVWEDDESGVEVIASAFTVAELGEMLPMKLEDKYVFDTARVGSDQWYVSYRADRDFREFLEADTEADARAKMLIYLLENKLINL